jgi:hypothetical protein
MSLRSWIRNVFARPVTRPTRKAPNRARLVLEALEDRLVPSTFTVTNTLDDGSVGSLRWAVNQANANPGQDWIDFSSAVFNTPKTITLTGGQLTLADTGTTIIGPGAGLLSISGNNASRVLQINPGVTEALSGLTLTGGRATDGLGGDGLLNYGTTFLAACNISNNSAGDEGGMISENGVISMSNCTVSGNHAAGPYTAGGLTIEGGKADVFGCTFSGNSAASLGGVFNDNASVWLTECTVSGNSAALGGVVMIGSSAGTTLDNCTLSGNSSSNGSALDNFTGVANRMWLLNTIVAGQTAGGDITGPAGGSNNLIGTGGSGGLVNEVNGNIVGVANPLLAPLGNYGGPTQTMALLPGSPAIDAGSNAIGYTTDQRGLPRIVNGTVDIGAFESSGFTISVVSAGGQVLVAPDSAFAPLVVRVTANNPIEPVAGGLVTFTAPSSEASVLFFSRNPALIQADGTASVTATAAGGIKGAFPVSATASGIMTPATFQLYIVPSGSILAPPL